MQFKKPTSIGDAFAHGHFGHGHEQWLADFLKSDETYAVASDQSIIRRFRVVLKNGDYYSIPYAFIPAVIYSGGQLYIRSQGLLISISGKGLSIIEQYLNTENLLYIKESTTGININNDDVFISNITVEGRSISTTLPKEEL
ncbi:hypothetical protein [Tenacibaculum agarivorans]|uniref:hypothetical protein n=1 Tax=Tenacibaculum agarivorans TaxID=1908389 RepID=UPI00094B8FFE|nr:hypothetical protein [Tenacibaculum agarivorans]